MKRKARILVVDDQEEVRRFFAMVLSPQGFEVTAAADGLEALARLERHRPDLIFLDLVMPGMDGIDTLRRIKERDPAAKVVIFTAYASVETARQAMALGASEYLAKPFDLGLLLRVIQDSLGMPVAC